MVELGLKGRGERRTTRDRRDETGTRPRVSWSVVLTVIALVVGWLLAGFDDNRNIYARVTALEAQRVEDSRRMERIENKIDRLLEARKP